MLNINDNSKVIYNVYPRVNIIYKFITDGDEF